MISVVVGEKAFLWLESPVLVFKISVHGMVFVVALIFMDFSWLPVAGDYLLHNTVAEAWGWRDQRETPQLVCVCWELCVMWWPVTSQASTMEVSLIRLGVNTTLSVSLLIIDMVSPKSSLRSSLHSKLRRKNCSWNTDVLQLYQYNHLKSGLEFFKTNVGSKETIKSAVPYE